MRAITTGFATAVFTGMATLAALSPAQAQTPGITWHLVAADKTGAWAYSEASAPTQRIFAAYRYAEPKKIDGQRSFAGVIMTLSIDCANHQAQTHQVSYYAPDSTALGSNNKPGDWQPLRPASGNIDSVMAAKCAGQPLPDQARFIGDDVGVETWLADAIAKSAP